MEREMYDAVLEEGSGGEEFRMVMRLISLQLKRAIESDSDAERVRILKDLKHELETAAGDQ